jgi:uncharacterized protein YciI
MPLYAVLLEDEPAGAAEIRARHMPEHLAFLEQHADRIRAAGPLREADGTVRGGLWLVEADGPAAVEALVHADPFWPTGLRRAVRISLWARVFADGKRLG